EHPNGGPWPAGDSRDPTEPGRTMTEKTDLQRDILIEWYNDKDATNEEIAERLDCSPSYVSEVKNKFEDYDEFQATLDEEARRFEEITGMKPEELKELV
ncbi:MAG: hypothetical protein ABEI52_07170, partial [Halobacteriaceae archaeon]